MVVDHHPPAIRMVLNPLASLSLGKLKALMFEGADNATHRNVAQERNRWVFLTHMVTATTGSSMTWVVAFLGISSPAFCISRM